MRVVPILLAALAGCSAAQDVESEQSITRTIVHLQGDGDPLITTDVITVEEQQREVAARMGRPTATPSPGGISEAQQAITQDPGCASSDVTMFDQAGYTGHEICFFGAGTVDLSTYQRVCISRPIHVCSPWSGNVRSWSSYGPYSGRWVDPDGSYSYFFAPQWESTASVTVANAQYMTIFNP